MNFVLRAVAGAIIISVRVSPWLIMSCFFVALFLALGKRKAELNLRINSSAQTRESLRIYTKEIIDTLIFIPLVMVLVCYTMYCIFVFPVTQILRDYFLFLTLPIITFVIFRYVYLSNGTLVNQKLIEDGFTRHLSFFPLTKDKIFAYLELSAHNKNIGLWEVCPD